MAVDGGVVPVGLFACLSHILRALSAIVDVPPGGFGPMDVLGNWIPDGIFHGHIHSPWGSGVVLSLAFVRS